MVAEVVAPFTNQIVGGPLGSHTTAEQAATVLERMMARRGLECLDADRELLATLAREGNQAEETFPA
jgi:oligoendopeptidase F